MEWTSSLQTRDFEDYVGVSGLEEHGKKKCQRHVADVVKRLIAALEPDEVVLGSGNVKKLDALPAGTQAAKTTMAFRGGFRLWEKRELSGGSFRTARFVIPLRPVFRRLERPTNL